MDWVALSKEISYALRHAPWEYELELDSEGWVDVRQLIHALEEFGRWQGLTERDIAEMIGRSEKQRHELSGGRIRALYGHSTPQKIARTPGCPPEILYHGTARRFLESIRRDGLLPQARQYVHLSSERETATAVGKRRDEHPVLLRVRAQDAWRNGVLFYEGNDRVWLADRVPPDYLDEDA